MPRAALRVIDADLHVHTCLSPCGDLLFSPKAIVEAAVRRRIHMIAICDHNSAENVPAALRASEGKPVTVIPGMEVTSAEEVHLVTLFPDGETVVRMQDLVYQHLQPGKNDPRLFGDQVVVNEKDEVEAFNERLLISATTIPIERVVDAVHELGGLVIASHVDREMFGLIGQLGMIPENLALDAIEISKFGNARALSESCPGCDRFPVVRSSDAHEINDLGTITTQFRVASPTFEELRMALHAEQGREVLAR